MKIVINASYGGFCPSDAVFEELIKRGWSVTDYNDHGDYENPDAQLVRSTLKILSSYGFVGSDEQYRTNQDLIDVVETLGDKSNSKVSKLKVIEVPDDAEWTIQEYDGNEWVAENHRTWS